jgi:hypothetical protein
MGAVLPLAGGGTRHRHAKQQNPIAIAFAALFLILLAATAGAQERAPRLEVWDLRLGTPVGQLPDEFVDLACGTNGGPPSVPLSGWSDFRRCRPEPSGLREVYFRYDDELEYWAKANNLADQMEQYAGTKTYGFPIVVSGLIDAQGVLRGLRIVSDPRDASQNRDEAYLLRNFLTARFGRDNWQCQDLPLADGETPVDGVFVKQDCRKAIDDETTALVATRYLRKPGQTRIDPHTGRETAGQFESTARFELVQSR